MSRRVNMKVVMLGQLACGKTSLVERLIYNRFNANYQGSIGVAFGARRVKVQGLDVCVGVWDRAGSERYASMTHMYYRGAQAAVVCYDITDADSAERAKFWVTEIQKHEEQCRVWLCGTKLDLVTQNPAAREVDCHAMSDYAEMVGGRVVETSSKTGENVEELFNAVVQEYPQNLSGVLPAPDDSSFSLDAGKIGRIRSRCCHD